MLLFQNGVLHSICCLFMTLLISLTNSWNGEDIVVCVPGILSLAYHPLNFVAPSSSLSNSVLCRTGNILAPNFPSDDRRCLSVSNLGLEERINYLGLIQMRKSILRRQFQKTRDLHTRRRIQASSVGTSNHSLAWMTNPCVSTYLAQY